MSAVFENLRFCVNAYWCGQPLAELAAQILAYRQMMLKLYLPTSEKYCLILWETTLLLLGNPDKIKLSIEEISDQDPWISELLNSHDMTRIFYFYLHRATVRFLLGQITLAKADARQSRQYVAGGVATVCEAGFYFYDSLVALATIPESPTELESQLKTVEENQASLKLWAGYAPMNYLHKWQLVEAEKYRVFGKRLEAIEMYDQAIAGAKENEYIQEEAVANELAAKFYLDWGKEKVAAGYMQAAYYCYARWGAKAKTDDLENRYASLLRPILQPAAQDPTLLDTLAAITDSNLSIQASRQNSGFSGDAINTVLDFAAIFKASQNLSSTIQLDELLHQLTQIIMQYSGGDRCALILPNENDIWCVEAVATSEKKADLCSVPLEDNANLPVKLIQYVKNTQEVMVIDNLNTDLPIIDAYLRQQQPKSLLCFPLLNQGKLFGILYLENRSTRNLFTRDLILILNFLCTQAAISLKNARLYLLEQEKARQLRLSESRLKQLFEKAADAIILLGDQGLLDCNQAAIDLFRCPNKLQLYSIHLAQISPELQPDGQRSIDKANTLIKEALQTGSHRFEWVHQRLDGENFWAEVMLTAIPYQEETVLHSLIRDISDRKQAEEQIRRYTAQLEASNRELEAFSYSVSHDLRAPLRAIDGFSKVLLDDYGETFNEVAKDYFNRIRKNAVQMGKLIDDLLSLSRVSRAEIRYTTINLSNLAQELKKELQSSEPERQVEWVIAPEAVVSADATLMRIVLTNLLHNAWKFTRRHSTARIEFGILHQEGRPIYFVRDDGAGFDMAYSKKLFGVFQRLHNAHEFSGVGIGLATVQRAILRHGGSIWAEGSVEQGATFYFTIPNIHNANQ
ncbi:MAG: GAF domain-containing protein [Leptolyngbyaceae cyanobacterium MO_188.B28]|nr:GAF domain-containing protein [Leptolyngbyaceae cyanobacterium MO_188.B28]